MWRSLKDSAEPISINGLSAIFGKIPAVINQWLALPSDNFHAGQPRTNRSERRHL